MLKFVNKKGKPVMTMDEDGNITLLCEELEKSFDEKNRIMPDEKDANE